jgi:hypothetical protein
MKKKVIIISVLLIAGYFGYKYLYHDHRDIKNEKASSTISSVEIVKEFLSDETKANTKYLDKTVEISGKVASISEKEIVLDDKVFGILSEKQDVKVGDNLKLKGRLIGFDELLEQVKLDQCTIVK